MDHKLNNKQVLNIVASYPVVYNIEDTYCYGCYGTMQPQKHKCFVVENTIETEFGKKAS